jgi:hypothetical protein
LYIGESNSLPVEVVTGSSSRWADRCQSYALGGAERFLSHLSRTVIAMSNMSDDTRGLFGNAVDPFTDPVAYLAGLGIESELVETLSVLPEAA